MPAGPIGAVWAAGSWTDTCWEVGTWADEGAVISDGDEVMVLLAPNGIPCTVLTETTTTVRVVITSVKQIHVLTEGGTPIKVTI
jgi:hypothetical protein